MAVVHEYNQLIVIRRLLVRFPWSACWRVPGQDTEPQNCSWCAGWHLAWRPPPSVYECMNYCKLLWTKAPARCKWIMCYKKNNIFISFKVSLLLLCESLIISLLESPKCAFVFHIHKCVIQILRVTHQPLLTFVLFAWLPKHVSYVRAEHLFPLVLLHILRTEIETSTCGSPRLHQLPRDTGRMFLLGPTWSRWTEKKKKPEPMRGPCEHVSSGHAVTFWVLFKRRTVQTVIQAMARN